MTSRPLSTACRAVLIEAQALGMRNAKGHDMYALVLTVLASGHAPYEAHVASTVPVAALPLLSPGSIVPARRMPEGDARELVIDWEAAIAEQGWGARGPELGATMGATG